MKSNVIFYENVEKDIDTLAVNDELDINEDTIIEQAYSEPDIDDKEVKEASSALATSSLSHYMNKISGYNPLTRDEEYELGTRIKEGDKEAFDKLINSNLKFVVTVAYKFRNSGLPMLDIINQGNLGLVEAAKRFDPERGVKFISYAVWWIRQYIVQGVAEQSGTVRLPIKQASNLFKINYAREKLRQENSNEPSVDELAEHLKMKPEDVTDILRVSKQSLSLEAPVKEGEDRTFINMLEDTGEGVEESLIRDNLKNILNDMINELDPREMQIISRRFGLDDDEPQTLDELGKLFGVSRERVRQLEARALDKLRKKASKIDLQDYMAS